MDLAAVRVALHEAIARVLAGAVDEHVRTVLDYTPLAGVRPRALDLNLRAVRASDARRARRLPVALDVAAAISGALDLARARALSAAGNTACIGPRSTSNAAGAGISTAAYDAVEAGRAIDLLSARAVGAAIVGAGLATAVRWQSGGSAFAWPAALICSSTGTGATAHSARAGSASRRFGRLSCGRSVSAGVVNASRRGVAALSQVGGTADVAVGAFVVVASARDEEARQRAEYDSRPEKTGFHERRPFVSWARAP